MAAPAGWGGKCPREEYQLPPTSAAWGGRKPPGKNARRWKKADGEGGVRLQGQATPAGHGRRNTAAGRREQKVADDVAVGRTQEQMTSPSHHDNRPSTMEGGGRPYAEERHGAVRAKEGRGHVGRRAGSGSGRGRKAAGGGQAGRAGTTGARSEQIRPTGGGWRRKWG